MRGRRTIQLLKLAMALMLGLYGIPGTALALACAHDNCSIPCCIEVEPKKPEPIQTSAPPKASCCMEKEGVPVVPGLPILNGWWSTYVSESNPIDCKCEIRSSKTSQQIAISIGSTSSRLTFPILILNPSATSFVLADVLQISLPGLFDSIRVHRGASKPLPRKVAPLLCTLRDPLSAVCEAVFDNGRKSIDPI